MTKTYTPIEGTPYCFSRNSPLSSLSSGSESEDDDVNNGANKTEKEPTAIASIAEAHQVNEDVT